MRQSLLIYPQMNNIFNDNIYMLLNFYLGSNMFLEVESRFKASISEGSNLLIKTGPSAGADCPVRKKQKDLLEKIRLDGLRLTEAVLKTRQGGDLTLFARPLYTKLASAVGFFSTLREGWQEMEQEQRPEFDLEFCLELEEKFKKKQNFLLNHVPEYHCTPMYTSYQRAEALRLSDNYAREETQEEAIVARRLAYVFADLELRGLLWKMPQELVFEYVLQFVDTSPDYIRKNLATLKDGYKGDLSRASSYKYIDEGRDFMRRFNLSV